MLEDLFEKGSFGMYVKLRNYASCFKNENSFFAEIWTHDHITT